MKSSGPSSISSSSQNQPPKSQNRKAQRHLQRKEELQRINVELKKPSKHDELIDQESKVSANNLAINNFGGAEVETTGKLNNRIQLKRTLIYCVSFAENP